MTYSKVTRLLACKAILRELVREYDMIVAAGRPLNDLDITKHVEAARAQIKIDNIAHGIRSYGRVKL